MWKKNMFEILVHVLVKIGIYSASIMDYSVILCDEVIKS